MNRNRSISIVVLVALLLAQALPAHAGGMLCPMKDAAPAKLACSACVSSAASASNGLLRARNCCTMKQSEARDATPGIIPASRRAASFEPQNLLVAPTSLLAASAPENAVRAIAWSGPPATSLLASSFRTTILRN